ncbi:MAG TPA: hypothetical protein VFS92_03670, partial [Planctomycetota bacterium]|nr:hypothetical protein [Planctomycetota bacterium]
SGVLSMREAQSGVGRILLEIQRLGDPISLGATTFPIFCEQAGLSPVEGRELRAMAEAAEAIPEVEARVVEARITPQKAAIVNEVLKRPELQRPGEDLLQFVESRWAKDLVNEVKRRKEEARLGEPPVGLTIQVSVKGRDDFRRCQTLVSRSLDRMATEGETLERISDEYLQRHDPERTARRLEGNDKAKASLRVGRSEHPLPSASAVERSRHVPATDTRELLRAAGDRCWVDGCSNEAFLQYAHRRAFRANGSNTSRNLLRLCRKHPAQFDAGLWWLACLRDGQVALMDRRGVRVGRLRDEAAAFVSAQRRAPP